MEIKLKPQKKLPQNNLFNILMMEKREEYIWWGWWPRSVQNGMQILQTCMWT